MVRADQVGSTSPLEERTEPPFSEQAKVIAQILKQKTRQELQGLCGVSSALSVHVKDIYDAYELSTAVEDKSRFAQAALMFDGPAFRGRYCPMVYVCNAFEIFCFIHKLF